MTPPSPSDELKMIFNFVQMTQSPQQQEVLQEIIELRKLEPSICLDRVEFPIYPPAVQYPVEFYSNGISMVCASIGEDGYCEITGKPTHKCPQEVRTKYCETNYTNVS